MQEADLFMFIVFLIPLVLVSMKAESAMHAEFLLFEVLRGLVSLTYLERCG
jgi:hypothetical protein